MISVGADKIITLIYTNKLRTAYYTIAWCYFQEQPEMSVNLTDRKLIVNTYSMKQPDLYYFETIKMTSQTWSNFVWRIRVFSVTFGWVYDQNF